MEGSSFMIAVTRYWWKRWWCELEKVKLGGFAKQCINIVKRCVLGILLKNTGEAETNLISNL